MSKKLTEAHRPHFLHQQHFAVRRTLPKLRLTMREFMELPEYSGTHPTGTTPGKRWRRHNGTFDRDFILAGGVPSWEVWEYDPLDDGKTPRIKINRYMPVVRVPAGRAVLEHGGEKKP